MFKGIITFNVLHIHVCTVAHQKVLPQKVLPFLKNNKTPKSVTIIQKSNVTC